MNLSAELPLELRIKSLTEGAKYDVSCSSSGGETDAKKGFLGNTAAAGICHAFSADGRCISLLKILMSNHCEFDCEYCVNRRSNDIPRARISPKELAELVVGFYKRNYIEGLFLSSAVEKSPNHTMLQMIEAVRLLREEYRFRGYIHVKAIPGADRDLIELAAQLADRMSVNIELPSEASLKKLAPQKKRETLLPPMKQLAGYYLENRYGEGYSGIESKTLSINGARRDIEIAGVSKSLIKSPKTKLNRYGRRNIPAGQTTQMIIGASPDTDGQIIRLSEALYRKYEMKRVYYSAYIPIVESSLLPAVPPDLKREHRLYEADWLLRFYGFDAEELLPAGYNFSLDVDPKCDWALRNIDRFPVEVNTAPFDMLLRVPGIGVKNANRICMARRHARLNFESLKKMRVVLKRAKHFITAGGKYLGVRQDPDFIRAILADNVKALPEESKRYVIGEQMDFASVFNSITGQF